MKSWGGALVPPWPPVIGTPVDDRTANIPLLSLVLSHLYSHHAVLLFILGRGCMGAAGVWLSTDQALDQAACPQGESSSVTTVDATKVADIVAVVSRQRKSILIFGAIENRNQIHTRSLCQATGLKYCSFQTVMFLMIPSNE